MKMWTLLGFTLLLSSSKSAQMANPNGSVSTTLIPETGTYSTDTTDSITPENGTNATHPTSPATEMPPVTATDSITIVQDLQCVGKNDFDPCKDPENAGCKKNSMCSCKDQKHFCRCNNDKDKWYIGDNCEEEWTVLTFALVASLPGLALAIIVGVAVHCGHHFRKKGKATSKQSSQTQKAIPPSPSSKKKSNQADENLNIVFTSDLQEQKPQPASGRSAHDSIPMSAQPYGGYRNEGYRNPYANPQPVRSPYNSPDDYRYNKEPPARQNGISGGTPFYSAPDYNSPPRQQFPRAHMGRQY